MGPLINQSVRFQANPCSSVVIQQIFSWLSTTVFSIGSKGNISGYVPIPLRLVWYGQILVPEYHGTFTPTYLDINICPYQDIYRSPYVHIYVTIYLDIIHTYLMIYGYMANHLSSHPLGHICNRLLSPPIRPLTDLNCPFQYHRSHYDPFFSPPSEQRRLGKQEKQALPMEDLCRRPPYCGRLSIALPLTLAGQKGPISFWGNRSKRRLGRASPACLYGAVKGVLKTLQGFS